MRQMHGAVNTHFCCLGPHKLQFVSPTEHEVEARQEVQCREDNTLYVGKIRMYGVRDTLQKKDTFWKARLTHELNAGPVTPFWYILMAMGS